MQWPQEWLSIPITAKELAPIVVASMLWGLGWYGQRVQFVCDNMAVVACVNSGSSKDSLVMHLLQALWFVSAKFCFEVHAVHIPGQLNQAADALSRGNQSSFFSVFPQAKPVETQIPCTWVDLLSNAVRLIHSDQESLCFLGGRQMWYVPLSLWHLFWQ